LTFLEPTHPPARQVCGDDYECSHKETCNAYTKNCERCKLRGELCRRSGNCCNEDLRCIWGRCIDPLKTDGKKNHRCYNQKDCRPGFCCAKYEGESVCRPLLLEGDSCEVPPGGISFTINHKCPCGKGLRCQAKSTVRKHDLRCAYTNETLQYK